MKPIITNTIVLALCGLLIIACKTKTEQQEAEDVQQEVDSLMQQSKVEAGVAIWDIDYEKKTMTRNKLIDTADLSVDSLIIGLNTRYPNIKLEKVAILKDTLITRIADPTYLNERSGSSGAEMYVTEAIMNLTSAPGIRFLRIDFKQGTHASPGVWKAADITELRRIE